MLRTIVLLGLLSHTAAAQGLDGIDFQGAALPLSTKAGSLLESSEAPLPKRFTTTFRATYLDSPISTRLPSPSQGGSRVPIVEHAVLGEVSATVGLTDGWDAGFGFGAHLFQSGAGVNQNSSAVSSFGARDPRLGVGWSVAIDNWRFRPFAQAFIPLGNRSALAGERGGRFKTGFASSSPGKWVRWNSEVSFVYRPETAVSSTTWGPQFFIAQGLQSNLWEGLSAHAEILVAPVLSRQTSRSGERGGSLVPAEALLSLRYGESNWSIGLGGGTGLPLSKVSSVQSEEVRRRGPTAPVFRGFLDVRVQR